MIWFFQLLPYLMHIVMALANRKLTTAGIFDFLKHIILVVQNFDTTWKNFC